MVWTRAAQGARVAVVFQQDAPASNGFFDVGLSNPFGDQISSYTVAFRITPHGTTTGAITPVGTVTPPDPTFPAQNPGLNTGADASYFFVTDFFNTAPHYTTADGTTLFRILFNVSPGTTGVFDITPVLIGTDASGTPDSSIQHADGSDFASSDISFVAGSIAVPEPVTMSVVGSVATLLMVRRPRRLNRIAVV